MKMMNRPTTLSHTTLTLYKTDQFPCSYPPVPEDINMAHVAYLTIQTSESIKYSDIQKYKI